MRARLTWAIGWGWLLIASAPAWAQELEQDTGAKVAASKIETLPQGAVKLTLTEAQRDRLEPVAPMPRAEAVEVREAVAPAPPVGEGASTGTSVKPAVRKPRVRASAGASQTSKVLQLPLALEGVSPDQADKMRVISDQTDASIRVQPGQRPVLEVPVNGRAILSSDQGKQSAEQDALSEGRKTALPWLVIETERHGEQQAVRAARPFLTLAKAITWNEKLERHVAEFLFGLDPEGGSAGALQQPVEARFAVSCDDVDPPLARVEKIGPGGYGSVRVSCSAAVKNQQPQQFLSVHVEQGTLRYPFAIPRRPGMLRLLASALSVPGFGFGQVALTVEQLEEDGSPLQALAPTDLQLSADRSSLGVDGFQIPKGASAATLDVHPHGIGALQITVVQGPLRSPPLSLQLTWPVLAVLAMIVGGSLGGVLFLFGPRTKPAGPVSIWRKQPVLRRAVEGALVGLLVTALVLIIPSLAIIPAWARSTELGMFVLSACAGFLGTPLLDRFAHALFPALKAEPEG